jgi:signal peptidase
MTLPAADVLGSARPAGQPKTPSSPPTPWSGRLARVSRGARVALCALVLAAAGVAAVAVGSGSWQIRPVLSGSMRPTFPIGGAVVAQRVATSSLRVGEVVVLHPPDDRTISYMHRIVWLEHRGSTVLVRTKGDANTTDDPWTVRIDSPVSYEVRFVVPDVGYAAVWVHSPDGRRTMLALAGGAFLACGLSLVPTIRRRSRRRPAIAAD